jgi:hypothetical protein
MREITHALADLPHFSRRRAHEREHENQFLCAFLKGYKFYSIIEHNGRAIAITFKQATTVKAPVKKKPLCHQR